MHNDHSFSLALSRVGAKVLTRSIFKFFGSLISISELMTDVFPVTILLGVRWKLLVLFAIMSIFGS